MIHRIRVNRGKKVPPKELMHSYTSTISTDVKLNTILAPSIYPLNLRLILSALLLIQHHSFEITRDLYQHEIRLRTQYLVTTIVKTVTASTNDSWIASIGQNVFCLLYRRCGSHLNVSIFCIITASAMSWSSTLFLILNNSLFAQVNKTLWLRVKDREARGQQKILVLLQFGANITFKKKYMHTYMEKLP